MSQLITSLSSYWNKIQGTLFPFLEEELDPLTIKQQQLIKILELVRIEESIPRSYAWKGRPQKGQEKPIQEPTRIEKQKNMTLTEMIADLPKECGKGGKKDSKGNTMYWTGYKLHLDVVCGCIPVSAIVTSASVHDSQVAIPLATITAQRTTVLYDLMDSAYDIPGIIEHSRSLGHVPLIDKNPRGNKELQAQIKAEAKAKKTLNLVFPEEIHYNARTTVERANSCLKDEFGACQVRVRGHAKVTCHLMFSVLVLAADQLM